MADIIIIGAGAAGMTAALYARRAGRSVLLLEQQAFGGQILLSPRVENYPAIAQISGSAFADQLLNQVLDHGAEVELTRVLRVAPNEQGFLIHTEDGAHSCRALILATGLTHRPLGVAREEELIGKGVSYCTLCDGAFYQDKICAVVGGGDSAALDALTLSNLCREVYLIHRRACLRASAALTEKLSDVSNIRLLLEQQVTALLGEPELSGLKLANTKTGTQSTLSVDGLFVSIGRIAQNESCSNLVNLDAEGLIIAGEDCLTSCPGVFAAGDCRTKSVRQLTTATADGAVCAFAACRYLDHSIRNGSTV